MKKGSALCYSLLIGLGFACAAAAQGQNPQNQYQNQYHGPDVFPDVARGFYAGGGVRANVMEDANLHQAGTSTGGHITFDPGAGFSIRGGYRFCEFFALEGETGSTVNSIDEMTGASSVDAFLYQVPFMANALFTIPTRSPITPFFGAGAGGTTSIIDVHHINLSIGTVSGNDTTTTFTYQFFGGLHYAVNDRVSAGLIYSFRAVDGPRWDQDVPIETGQLRNHFVGFSANFRF